MAARQLVVPPRFELLRRIGEGGMGVVYEALDVERGVRVALKTVLHRNADALARFKHEFRALQDIHHPNLVALGELLGEGDDVFFTMELVEGVDLLAYVRGEKSSAAGSRSNTSVDSAPTVIDTLPPDLETAAALPPVSSGRAFGVEEITAEMAPVAIASIPPGAFDEARLRSAFRQIALGLTALHDARRIHRDVKPSNVRVTPEDRVVLLDFGLVSESGGAHPSTEIAVVGTPAYMAPEQAATAPVGPPADWYAVGVMLYQCLTGRVPFEGAAMAVMMAKQYQEPLAPSRLVRDVPEDLDALCLDLLKFEPSARPNGREVLKRLHSTADASVPSGSGSQPGAPPFVGRAAELEQLARALGDATAGSAAVTVALYGESGVGKSCLARRFLETLPGGRDELVTPDPSGGHVESLVLSGRCYEREAVPYKAFDEVVDTLSRRLARLPAEEVTPLLPPNVASLALLFPALCRVPGISLDVAPADADPHERRRAAFQALRGLLDRIARTRPLVLSIDDLQWTDADSLSLLVEVLRPPGAPRLLLLATMRGDAEVNADDAPKSAPGEPVPPRLLEQLPGDVRAIHVGRLPAPDARQLAMRLLKRASPALVPDAGAIAGEAGGHPLFIDELVRHAALTLGGPSPVALRLDDALRARVDRLEAPVRRVLEVACVVGAPLSQEIVAQAAGLDMREFARAVSLLRTSNLVRTSGGRVSDAIAPYHDRVREAVVAGLAPEARRARHERIASAIEGSKAYDPEVLAVHWAGAGEPAKASRYAVVAAEQAAQALAFARAARLYQRALDLAPGGDQDGQRAPTPDDEARRRTLRRRLGDALANTGQGVAAAAEYERAAVGAGAIDGLDLRRRAAEQLLRSGEIARGTEATAAVLAAVGMRLPLTTLGAIVAFLWYRLLLRLRGFRYQPRDEGDIPPSELTRLDICWSVSYTLTYADVVRGAVFQARHSLLALRAGESLRVARSLATEVSYLGTLGGGVWSRTERMMARARDVAERSGHPYARALVLGTSGIAYCMNLRFKEAIDHLERAVELFRERCPGSAWEVTTAQFFLFVSMSYACRFRELRAQHEVALKDAVDRGDHYGAVMLRVGVLNRVWWLGADPERARRELAEAARAWPAPGLHVTRFHHAVAEVYLDLYEGEGERAHERVLSMWPVLRRSLLLKVEALRLEWLGVRVRAATAAAAAMGDDRAAEREQLMLTVERWIPEYGPPDHRAFRPTILSVRASLAATRGKMDAARALVLRLAEGADSEEGWPTWVCARWLAGRLRGGIEGEAQVQAAESELLSRTVVPDRRLILLLFPGFARAI